MEPTGRLQELLRQAEGRLSINQMLELLTQLIELRCSIRQQPVF